MLFGEVNCALIANRDMGNFVPFGSFFTFQLILSNFFIENFQIDIIQYNQYKIK